MADDRGSAPYRGARSSRAAVPFGMRVDQILASPELAQHRLCRRLERSQTAGWEAAFQQFWFEVAPEGPPVWPPPEGRANWLWLTDLPRGGRGLDLGSPFGDIAAEFGHWFDHVGYLCPDQSHCRASTLRLAREDTPGDCEVGSDPEWAGAGSGEAGGTWDCIAQIRSPGWWERTPRELRDPAALVRWAHARLRKGGWLVLGGRNPYALRHGTGADRLVSRPAQWLRNLRLSLALQRAGFHDIRPYHALPSVWNPDAIVPYRWRAVRAFRAVTEHRSPGAFALRSRLHPFLSSDFLLLARR